MSARPRPLRRPTASAAALLAALSSLAGCRTTRVIEVTSNPPGALVRLDEEVIGRTPLEHEFHHYGRRRLTLYLPGYLTWSRRVEPKPPWYSRFPLDLLTEVLVPLGLTHRFAYRATLLEDTGVDETGVAPATQAFVERAVDVRRSRIERPGAAAPDEDGPAEPVPAEAGPVEAGPVEADREAEEPPRGADDAA